MKTAKAEQVVLSPAEELNVVGLEKHLPELLEGRVVTKGDMIPVNMVGRKIGFMFESTRCYMNERKNGNLERRIVKFSNRRKKESAYTVTTTKQM